MICRFGARAAVLAAILGYSCYGALAQTTWYVDDNSPGDPVAGDPSVSDPNENGSAAHPFDAIQEAIDASVSGDTVLIRDGNYTGAGNRDIDFGGREITVQSENGAANCIIDCQGSAADRHRGFIFQTRETQNSILDGVTIINGFAPFTSGNTVARGGGVYVVDASPLIRNCVLRNNRAIGDPDAGQLITGGGLAALRSSITLLNCVIEDNAVDSDQGGEGAGLYFQDSSPTITGCRITGNTTGDGDTPVDEGFDGGPGGGIRFRSCASAIVDGCVITRNRTGTGGVGAPNQGPNGDGGSGAGISSAQSTLIVKNTILSENVTGPGADSAAEAGGGTGGFGAGMEITGGSVTVINCRIAHNQTGRGGMFGFHVPGRLKPGGHGAGIYSTGSLTVMNTLFLENTTGDGGDHPLTDPNGHSGWGGNGGGIAVIGRNATITNCLFAGNRTGAGGVDALGVSGQSGAGAGIFFDGNGRSLTVTNCTFTNNEVTLGPGPRPDSGAIEVADGVAEIHNSIAWANRPMQFDLTGATTANVSYSDVQGGWAGAGNVDVDPLFVDADGPDNDPNTIGDNDYHLGAGSPVIDAADNGLVPADALDLDGDGDLAEPVPLDLDGGPRFVDDPAVPDTGAGAPPIADMGAFEGPDSPCANGRDCNGNGVDDTCDIASGAEEDCNGNFVPDTCDLADGTATDCNGNGLPDDCDIASGFSEDCNGNGVPDSCDFADGTATDCNGNGIPDSCDIVSGFSADCDEDGTPDECQTDCNHDGVPDACQPRVLGPFDGFAVTLDGVDDFGRIVDDAALNFANGDSITIEAWVSLNNATGTQTIVAKNRAAQQNYFLRIANGSLSFGYRNSTSTETYEYASTAAVFDASRRWVHVAVTHVFGTPMAELFVDGTPIPATWTGNAPTLGPLTGTLALLVGAQRAASGPNLNRHLSGAIDELRIWNVVRTPGEIQTFMQQPLTGGEAGLVAYLRMDEGAGDTAFDSAGAHDMSLRNGAGWQVTDACDCPGDVDDDGDVDLTDLAILLASHGATVTPYQSGDLNGDGIVDLTDLAILLTNFDRACP